MKTSTLPLILLSLFCFAMNANAQTITTGYKPSDPVLYAAILQQDSIYFTAYSTCDMVTQTAMYHDDIEFYHDNGGLTTSKTDLIESIRKNICGKVTRELITGSVEVYPIKNFGAVQIGYHRFHNKQENSVSGAGRFVIIWERKN